MPTHRVKLVDDAVAKAKGQDVNVGFLESQERLDIETGDDGRVLVRPREYDRLRLHGLIDEAAVESPGQKNPGDEDPNPREVSQVDRQPTGTTVTPPGGVGHQAGDAYGNDAVQRELARDNEQGAALRAERGLFQADDAAWEASRRSDHALPEQVKEYEQQTKEHESAVEKARKEAEKDQAKAAKDQEREEDQAQKDLEKERRERAKQTREVVSDSEAGQRQGQAGAVVDTQNQDKSSTQDQSKAKARVTKNDRS